MVIGSAAAAAAAAAASNRTLDLDSPDSSVDQQLHNGQIQQIAYRCTENVRKQKQLLSTELWSDSVMLHGLLGECLRGG